MAIITEAQYESFTHEIARLREENAELIEAKEHERARAESLKATLRSAIVAEYDARIAADPKAGKSLGDGLSVQVRTKYEYDTAEAAVWAKENAPFMLKISVDAKLFEAAMKQLDKLPGFVTVKSNVVAVIKEEK